MKNQNVDQKAGNSTQYKNELLVSAVRSLDVMNLMLI